MKLTKILNEVLLEKVEGVQWLQKSYYFASQGHIPLTPNIAKILNGEKRIQVFHVTSAENALKLKALEGKKKSISTMTNIPMITRESVRGVWGDGVMFSLDGNLVINAKGDINSSPDEAGRRWINLRPLERDQKLGKQFLDYISQDSRLAELRSILIDDYNQPGTIADIKLSLSGKELNEFLTLYIQRSVEWIKENANEIVKVMQSDNLTGISNYDEIIVNEIKLTAAIVNIAELGSSIEKKKNYVEFTVGPENVTYVDSEKDPKLAKATIDKFILKHGGKLK